jgi:glucose/arabinose dehydrogenase
LSRRSLCYLSTKRVAVSLLVSVALVLALGLAAAHAEAAIGKSAQVQLTLVAGHLDQPVFATSAPGEPGRLYVVEQRGLVRVLQGQRLLRRPFLDIRSLVRRTQLLGLFSIAFDPNYQQTHRLFADYAGPNGNLYVAEFKAFDGGARRNTARVILHINTSSDAQSHDGGQLAFGPDGLLYVSVGDGLNLDAPQDLTSPLGKILRLAINHPELPPQIVAYGLRNPWRFSFDRRTGDLYIGDVGDQRWEEVDYLAHGATTIPNYGWSAYEGRTHPRDTPLTDPADLVPPLIAYPHRRGRCAAVVSGYVYRGHALAQARGRYFYGDLCSGQISSLRVQRGKATSLRREATLPGLASFAEDTSGELYAISVNAGTLYRITQKTTAG